MYVITNTELLMCSAPVTRARREDFLRAMLLFKAYPFSEHRNNLFIGGAADGGRRCRPDEIFTWPPRGDRYRVSCNNRRGQTPHQRGPTPFSPHLATRWRI